MRPLERWRVVKVASDGAPASFVRSGSVKRIAAAVGEGAQVVAAIHQHLARNHRTVSLVTAVGA